MIKKLAISIINVYQLFFSVIIKNILGVNKFCRFSETCSAFTKRSIEEKGLAQGLFLGLSRLLKCQPFYAVR